MFAHAQALPWFIWPFVLLAKLIVGLVILALRLTAIVVGGTLILAGLLLSLTIIGAIVGIPLALVGAFLVWLGFA